METTTKKIQAVYTVVSKSDGKELWLRLGSAFPNRDGSLTVLLDAVPTNGRLQIREYTPRDVAPRDMAPRREAAEASAP
jgi:hypothetical protein